MKMSTSESRVQYSNHFMEVRHTRADFGTFHKDYFVVELGPRAGIVAMKDNRILMTKQYRFLVDDYSWELPGGRVDTGETAEQAALRECLEETGVKCSALKPLVVYYPGLDNFDNRTTLFFSDHAEVLTPFEPKEQEVIEIGWFEVGQCLDMVFSGEILDALTVTGILAYEASMSRKYHT